MTVEESRNFHDIFEDTAEHKTEPLAGEYLAERQRITVEITIALPQKWKAYEKLSVPEKVDVYRQIWESVKAWCFCTEMECKDQYYIEYHQNGMPHLHGYFDLWVHPNTLDLEEGFMRSIVMQVYKHLPRGYWKHYENAKYIEHLRMMKSPAVVLNCKNILYKKWEEYIEKTQ